MITAHMHNELLEHLQQLEAELQAQQLWSATAPNPKALESTMPFMYDTLQLHEWLQWVFLPRLRALIDAKGQLPHQSHIHPLAEHEWEKRSDFDKRQLLLVLSRIDGSINGCGMTPPPAEDTRH
ncbi:YqcC family protein [Comamonas sp. lk]|uniref:YqcC family protein n=1 Tax=Comamonas sp. lk TaxID=2201272 RepID=UPI000EB27A74|nr:YqcC family protein [Comamonas sp. lk]